MEKGLSFVVAALGIAAAVIACSGSDSSSTFGSGQDAGGNDTPISPIVPDQPATDASAPSPTAKCDPAIPASFQPTWVAPHVPKACSAAEIKDYYDACLADPSKRDQCATWTTAHPGCTACLEPSDKSGPVQWYDTSTQPRLFFTLNVAGCIALKQDKLAATDCGGAYNAAVQCTRSSCTTCLETGGSFAQFKTCQQAVKQQGICKSYETQMSQTCQGAASATVDCFQGSTEAQDVFFQRVQTIFCGQ